MNRASHPSETPTDDPRTWIGGEATVSSQAHRYIRRQAGTPTSLLGAILGLTFLGGLALGSSFALLWRSKSE